MRRDHRELVKHAREAIGESGLDVDDAVFGRLARRMSYLHGDVTDAALDRRLAARVGRAKRPLYYLETWRIVQPLPTRILGLDDAEALVRGHPRWQPPWLPPGAEPGRPRGS